MPDEPTSTNRIRQRRISLGLTQAELAARAGISRTAVTAIEGERLAPSVDAALAIARSLESSVEELFGQGQGGPATDVWAWAPPMESAPCWQAEIGGRRVHYPASSSPMLSLLPDRQLRNKWAADAKVADETLVMACCDPAAGLLASQFAAMTGLRLLVLPRASRQAVEMLRDGLVHLAGLHLSTREKPDRNVNLVRTTLGDDFQAIRLANWQEGIALEPSSSCRSIRSVLASKLTWVGREPGSGARQCLDRLLENRPGPRRTARDHHGVVEAVRSGWADAGICVQLASVEAGLKFLPVQEEAFDVCFPTALADDRRVKAFLNVIRSVAYRRLLADLPGYDTQETGELCGGRV
ncbi:substrate-binding domain-containing protein [Schlesneria paludicola]|uniref:substrate-binding domain-containing protein n=1 Tax=Schlesneria paludicola TaxID=360056 RepID=UPI00058F5290|nr:substrate-binding domain-containing protein [Schlesneria paludicola]